MFYQVLELGKNIERSYNACLVCANRYSGKGP